MKIDENYLGLRLRAIVLLRATAKHSGWRSLDIVRQYKTGLGADDPTNEQNLTTIMTSLLKQRLIRRVKGVKSRVNERYVEPTKEGLQLLGQLVGQDT